MAQKPVTPIFIGGCDRSGTTYLANALSRAPGVIALPESHFFAEGARRAHDGPYPVTDFLNDVARHARYGDWRQAGCSEPQAIASTASSVPEAVNLLVRHFAKMQGWAEPVAFVEQAPPNAHYADALKSVFPSMRFLHIIRDGRAVAASWLPLDWGPNDIIDMARTWRREITVGLTAVQTLGAEIARNISYEDLIAQGDAAILSLTKSYGIYNGDRLEPHAQYAKPHYSASTHSLVGKNPDPSRINAWRTTLTSRQVEIFEALTGNLLDEFGYALIHNGNAAKPTLMERLKLKAVRRLRYRRNAKKFNDRLHGID